jgi:hypothetical protein
VNVRIGENIPGADVSLTSQNCKRHNSCGPSWMRGFLNLDQVNV